MKNLIQKIRLHFIRVYLIPGLVMLVFWVSIFPVMANAKPRPVESIPFNMIGTYVVIKVKINGSSPLNLILDSGIRHTIITELFEGDNITLNYSDVMDLMGLGGGEQLEAYSSNFNAFKIGKLKLENKTVLVLKEDVFNLSKLTGSRINGLIGADFFQDYVVEINYSSRRIRFYERKTFAPPKGFDRVPLMVESRKMFLNLQVTEADSTKNVVKMLIDTGAELNAWFQTYKKESVRVPAKNIRAAIGHGLNGEIKGSIARVPLISLGKYSFRNPVVAFPDSASISAIVGNSDRDGTVGSQILSRFDYFIDYTQRQFYFRPNGNFKKPFSYNIAGIGIAQILPLVPQTEVFKVWEDSPAARAGVREGDQIISINGEKAFHFNINELIKIFETPTRKILKLILLRGDKEIEVELDMTSKI